MSREDVMILAALVSAIAVVVNVVWTVYWAIDVRKQMKAAKNDARLLDLGNRMTRVEGQLENMPAKISSHEDVEIVHRRVTELRKTVDTISADVAEGKGVLDEIRKSTRAINDLLLRGPQQ